MAHEKWADLQIAALLEIGVDATDAQRSVKWTLDNLPTGEDPNTWIPDGHDNTDVSSSAIIHDARVAWYANDAVPARFKRLLDARQSDG
jgi:hypothetical protein